MSRRGVPWLESRRNGTHPANGFRNVPVTAPREHRAHASISHAPNGSDEARRVAPSGAAMTACSVRCRRPILAVIGAVRTALVHIDRARYDASLTVQALTERLRDDVDIVRVEADVLGLERTFHPTTAAMWLREAGQ